jgi:cytochrome c biogenesis protein
LGAIIGSLFGFKGFMAVTEGETQNQMFVRQDRLIDSIADSLGWSSSENPDAQGKMNIGHQKFKTLPFSIQCEDFSVTYYPNTGRPKDYKSDLVVIRDGQPVARKTLEVNDPLIVDDIYFYQSSYGKTGRPGIVVLSVAPPGGEKHEYRTPINGSFVIEGTDTKIEARSFMPDFDIMDGHVVQRSDEMINPALYLIAKQGEQSVFNGWIFPNYPDYSAKTEGYDIQFVDYWGWQYTGLQVAYDPGVEVVWIGCSLLVVGLMIAFFHSHQRIWARVSGNEIVLAGSTHKNRMAFEHKFNQLAKLLKT